MKCRAQIFYISKRPKPTHGAEIKEMHSLYRRQLPITPSWLTGRQLFYVFLPDLPPKIPCANHPRTTLQKLSHVSPFAALTTELDAVLWKGWLPAGCKLRSYAASIPPWHSIIAMPFFSTLTLSANSNLTDPYGPSWNVPSFSSC